jgi:hypothetical protein
MDRVCPKFPEHKNSRLYGRQRDGVYRELAYISVLITRED